MDAQTVSAWAPILIALFSLIGTVVAGYFAYRSRQDVAAVKTETAALKTEQAALKTDQTTLAREMFKG